MQKFFAYSVRSYEVELFKYWSAHFGIEVDLCLENLSEENVYLAQGYQGIICLGEGVISRKTLEQIRSYGITFMTSRSAGVDNIDVQAAKDLGISISNVPRYSPNSVSEFALLSTLCILRNFKRVIHRVQNQNFSIEGLVGREIRNQTIAVVGTGRIGYETLKNFSGFAPKEVLAFDCVENSAVGSLARYTTYRHG